MSAFVELERQLSESVAERGRPRPHAAVRGLGRWWRGRLRLRGGDLLVTIVVVVIAVALLAVRLERAARDTPLAQVAVPSAAEGVCRPCQAVGGRLHAPLAAAGVVRVRSALPARQVRVLRGVPSVHWVATGEGSSRL